MANENVLEALRGGMKAELESVGVYEEAAAKSEGEVRGFFADRAEEEKRHFNWLLEAYRKVEGGDLPENPMASVAIESPPIVTAAFIDRIAKDRFLSGAVAAAALLEVNAIRYYRGKAEESPTKGLAELFESLAAWEDRHYHELLRLQGELERRFFDENRFEPF
jgi:rubrerythrin